jgi:hypothetical protein
MGLNGVVFVGLLVVSASSPASAEPGGKLDPFEWNTREGLYYEDAARELRVDIDGRIALDWMHWDDRNTRSTQLRVDRALLAARVNAGRYADARVVVDLDGIDTRDNLWEAWAAVSPGSYARLTAGLLPIAFSMEHTLGEAASGLVGYPGFPAFLTSRTDWAARLDGELGAGLVYYELVAALGEGFDLFGQSRGDPQLAGRLTSFPLRFVDWELKLGPYTVPLLSGVFVNGAYALSTEYDGHLDVASPFRNKLFDTPRLDGDAASFWIFGYGADLGPFRVLHEFSRGSIDDVRLPSGIRRDFDDQITSWQLVLSWRLTGEPYDSRPFARRGALRPDPPARPLDGEDAARGLGSFELALRYANADIDRDFFVEGVTTPMLSSQEFRQVAAAASWYPTPALRVSAQVVRIIADQRPAVFDSRGRDTSYLLRGELHF